MSKPLDTTAIRAAILFVLSDAPVREFFEDHGGSSRWLGEGLTRCDRVDALRAANSDLRGWLSEFRRVARRALAERADLQEGMSAAMEQARRNL